MIEGHHPSGNEIDSHVAALRRHLQRGSCLTVYALLFQAWARKP